jgi:hypothetical protein
MGKIHLTQDVSSISRSADIVPRHRNCAMKVKAVLAVARRHTTSSPGATKRRAKVDHAVKVIDKVNNFLNQDISEVNYDDSLQAVGLPVTGLKGVYGFVFKLEPLFDYRARLEEICRRSYKLKTR